MERSGGDSDLRTKFGDVELEHYDMGNVGLRYPASTLWDGAEALMTIDTGKRPNYDPELGVARSEVSSSQLYLVDILVKNLLKFHELNVSFYVVLALEVKDRLYYQLRFLRFGSQIRWSGPIAPSNHAKHGGRPAQRHCLRPLFYYSKMNFSRKPLLASSVECLFHFYLVS